MATSNNNIVPTLDFAEELGELKHIAPHACADSSLANEIVTIIDRHLKPLPDAAKQRSRIAALIGQFAHELRKREAKKRPQTRAGTLRSLEAFITKDVHALLKEYAAFEARAEKALIENPAMHLAERGIARHTKRALDIIARFTKVIAEQTEHTASFRSKLGDLEGRYYDRENWALHLHDRINRLTNLFAAADTAVTSLKRALVGDRPFAKALASLRALRDDSLNPLEFIDAVFGGHDNAAEIAVSLPHPRLHYANHFLVREILMELVHNAVTNNASRVKLKLCAQSQHAATLAVEDDCPGGMPSEHGGGWGLVTVRNTLIPRLGPQASITFESPLADRGGTRVLVTVPIITTLHDTQDNTRIARHCGHIPACAFRSLDPFAVGGTALVRKCITTSMTLF